MPDTATIFLAGASRGVGWEVASLLASQGKPVKAMLRSPDARNALEKLGATVVMGDALEIQAVEAAMQPEPIPAVISTIGGLPKDGGTRADFLGNKYLIDVAKQVGVKKFILVSSIGTADSAKALNQQTLDVLGPVLAEKEQAEQYLATSGLTYTVIRPGGLKSEPPTGNGILTEDSSVAGTITRADVAQLICECLTSDKANNRILAAVDKDTVRSSAPYTEFFL
ncbi:SDR family oxidoreductase [Geitlerinema sp. PCC 9228]|jgi:nucleoside-diphosphate-sugar epimerase|uniref:SDR family oxidoreductase n=1 Tax=Geitlerinema sp. PCC 9228 TaxID=111611 RepID=UPI0008F9C649|nr:SDR family oxidoreductase [Geitlerinema sp. PCC 9228]